MRAREAADFFYKVKEGKGTTSSELRACVYVHLRAPHIGRGSTRNLILLQEEDPLLIFRELGKVNPRYILASRKSEDHLVLFGFCTFEDGADFENGFMPVRLVLGDV